MANDLSMLLFFALRFQVSAWVMYPSFFLCYTLKTPPFSGGVCGLERLINPSLSPVLALHIDLSDSASTALSHQLLSDKLSRLFVSSHVNPPAFAGEKWT